MPESWEPDGPVGLAEADAQTLDATAARLTHAKRERLGRAAVMSLNAVLKNAAIHKSTNEVFDVPVRSLLAAIRQIIDLDGVFDLRLMQDNLTINHMPIKFTPTTIGLAQFVARGFAERGLVGLVSEPARPFSRTAAIRC